MQCKHYRERGWIHAMLQLLLFVGCCKCALSTQQPTSWKWSESFKASPLSNPDVDSESVSACQCCRCTTRARSPPSSLLFSSLHLECACRCFGWSNATRPLRWSKLGVVLLVGDTCTYGRPPIRALQCSITGAAPAVTAATDPQLCLCKATSNIGSHTSTCQSTGQENKPWAPHRPA